MQITLHQFETIDSLHDRLVRMGDFETCDDPRGYIRTSNMLFDACVDACGYGHVDGFASAQDCAADLICRALSSATLVMAA